MLAAKKNYLSRIFREHQSLVETYQGSMYMKQKMNVDRTLDLSFLLSRNQSECPVLDRDIVSLDDFIKKELVKAQNTVEYLEKHTSSLDLFSEDFSRPIVIAHQASVLRSNADNSSGMRVLEKMALDEKSWDSKSAVLKHDNGMLVRRHVSEFPQFIETNTIHGPKNPDIFIQKAIRCKGNDPNICASIVETCLTMIMIQHPTYTRFQWPQLVSVKEFAEKEYSEFPYTPTEIWPLQFRLKTMFVRLEIYLASVTFDNIWLELDLVLAASKYKNVVSKAYQTMVVNVQEEKVKKTTTVYELVAIDPFAPEFSNLLT